MRVDADAVAVVAKDQTVVVFTTQIVGVGYHAITVASYVTFHVTSGHQEVDQKDKAPVMITVE